MLATLFAAAAILAPAGAHPPAVHHHHHTRGCSTPACDVRVGRAWDRKERERRRREQARRDRDFRPTTFELCVANREEGEPGATTISTVRWDTQQGVYEGGYSEEHSKWVAGGGLRYAANAHEATPIQQIRAFRQNGRNGEWTLQNWPTIARCR